MKKNEKRSTGKSFGRRLLLVVPLVALGLSLLLPVVRGESPLNLGVDLAGGVVVTYRPDFEDYHREGGALPDDAVLGLAKDALASRLYRKLSTVPEVVVRSDQRVVVSIPEVADHRAVLALVGKTYHLSLRLVAATHGEPGEGVPRYPYEGRYLELEEPAFTGDMLAEGSVRVQPSTDLSDPSAKVSFAFRSPHDDAFARFTDAHRGQTLAILLDQDVEWAGVIEGEIRGSGLLAGGYTLDEAGEIVSMLRAGTLPIGLEVESLRAVGPGLGQALKGRGVQALGLALVALVGLVTIAYGHRRVLLVTGLLSLGTLLLLIVGLAALFGLTLDLVGIAGIVLSVGMGMDAFVIVFEALEARRRHEPESMVRHHGRIVQALYSFAGEGATLFHANATTLVVIALLLATERLRSFALFIGVGILASVLTIFVTRSLLGSLPALDGGVSGGSGVLGWLRRARPGFFRLRWAYVLGLVAFLLGTGLVLSFGVGRPMLAWGADFRPGTQIEVSGREPAALETALSRLAALHPEVAVRSQGLEGEPGRDTYMLTLDALVDLATSGEPAAGTLRADTVLTTFREAGLEVGSLHTIDGRVSASRMATSLSVLGLSFGLLAVYMVWLQEPLGQLVSRRASALSPPRTRLWVLVGMIVAVVADVALVLAALAWLALPIGLPVVAALLTVIGYSVNDSVVLWTHIESRWSDRKSRGKDPVAVVSRSVDAILVRAGLTSLSTMVPALAILAVGLEPLRGFAWAVLVGSAAGTLSSLFIVGAFASRAMAREDDSVSVPSLGSTVSV